MARVEVASEFCTVDILRNFVLDFVTLVFEVGVKGLAGEAGLLAITVLTVPFTGVLTVGDSSLPMTSGEKVDVVCSFERRVGGRLIFHCPTSILAPLSLITSNTTSRPILWFELVLYCLFRI